MAQRTSTNWAVDESVTAARVQTTNTDLDTLFQNLMSDNVSITGYDTINDRVTEITDNENGVVWTLDWSMFADPTTPYFELSDDTVATNTWRFNYSAATTVFTGYTKTI